MTPPPATALEAPKLSAVTLLSRMIAPSIETAALEMWKPPPST